MNIGFLKCKIANEPDLKSSKDFIFCKFTVFIPFVKKDKTNQKTEFLAHFFDCLAFGEKAKIILSSFKKKDEVILTYKLEQSYWTDSFGNKKSKVVLIVLEIQKISKQTTEHYQEQSFNKSKEDQDDQRLQKSSEDFLNNIPEEENTDAVIQSLWETFERQQTTKPEALNSQNSSRTNALDELLAYF